MNHDCLVMWFATCINNPMIKNYLAPNSQCSHHSSSKLAAPYKILHLQPQGFLCFPNWIITQLWKFANASTIVHIIMIVVDYLMPINSNGLQILWSEELQRLLQKQLKSACSSELPVLHSVILFVFGGMKYLLGFVTQLGWIYWEMTSTCVTEYKLRCTVTYLFAILPLLVDWVVSSWLVLDFAALQ